MVEKAQANDACMVRRFLADARFDVYLQYAAQYVDADEDRLIELAVALYRWNVQAASMTIGYISFVEVFVRNAIDRQLRQWVASQHITDLPDWLEVGDRDPIGRIRALINSAERDYLTEARNAALRKKRQWRSDQTHPRHGDSITRDDVFSQLTFGTWDGMLARSSRDMELAHVLMKAFPNIEDAWSAEVRRMPKVSLPGKESDPREHRLRLELIDRLKSIRTVRNRISHDENLLRVEFSKLRHDMFFVLNALGAECPQWAFPDKIDSLKTMSPRNCIAAWASNTGKTGKEIIYGVGVR